MGNVESISFDFEKANDTTGNVWLFVFKKN